MFRDPPEVTEGFFSRCEKKNENNSSKPCGCAEKEKKKEEASKPCGCKEKTAKSVKSEKTGKSACKPAKLRKSKSKSRCKSRCRRSKRALNAFIIFYLEMYKKTKGKHVTCVAIEAGKKWCSMSDKEKEKYIQMAKARKDGKKEIKTEEKKEVKKC